MVEEGRKIEELINRFLKGETTNSEEKILYDFFKGEDIPSYLQCYKKEFIFYSAVSKSDNSVEKRNTSPKKKQFILKRALIVISTAACLIGFAFIGSIIHKKKNSNPFKGSYIVYENTIITDLNIIQPELEQELMKMIKKEQEINKLISKMQDINRLSEGAVIDK